MKGRGPEKEPVPVCSRGLHRWGSILTWMKRCFLLSKSESPDGDTTDYIPMSQQPTFDHPLLKNHTLQMRPNYLLEGLQFDMNKMSNLKNDVKPIAQLWHLSGRCPQGTIPVRRVKQEDLFRASSVERFGKKKTQKLPKVSKFC